MKEKILKEIANQTNDYTFFYDKNTTEIMNRILRRNTIIKLLEKRKKVIDKVNQQTKYSYEQIITFKEIREEIKLLKIELFNTIIIENNLPTKEHFFYQTNGEHNIEVIKSQQKHCPNCGKKCKTIAKPNDPQPYSRSADYRIICFKCKKTYLLHYGNYGMFALEQYNSKTEENES